MSKLDKTTVLLDVFIGGHEVGTQELSIDLFPIGSGIRTLLELDENSVITIDKTADNTVLNYRYKGL